MEWREPMAKWEAELLFERNSPKTIKEMLVTIRIANWRYEIEKNLLRLLKAVNIDRDDVVTIRQRCRCEGNEEANKTEERYFIDNKLVLVASYYEQDMGSGQYICDIVAPITERED